MNIFTAYLLPLIVALIMLAMGLALSLRDFTVLVREPKAFAVGFFCQLVILPLLGFMVANLTGMPPELAVGLMIVSACPGGPMSNLLTHLAHGDTALSISLTACVSGISILTLPLITGFALDHFMAAEAPALPVAGTITGLSIMTLLPVSIGMLIKWRMPYFAQKAEPVARRAAAVTFVLFIVAAVIMEWEMVRLHALHIAPSVLMLNLAAMIVAWLIAQVLGVRADRVVALTLECGIQNGSLAMFVAASLLHNEVMMLPGAAYGLFMFPTALLFVGFTLQRGRSRGIQEAK